MAAGGVHQKIPTPQSMNMLSVPYFDQLILKGVVIVLAVWLDVRSKRRS
jgi:ABC-type xylose transport system permease subunit